MEKRQLFVLFVIFTCFVSTQSLPTRTNTGRSKVTINRFKRWSELFGPYDDLIGGNRVCIYKDRSYADGAPVVPDEPCLKCRCHRGALVCYLRICPVLPDPPPFHCVVVHRKGACCAELICEDNSFLTNHISRAEPLDTNQSPGVVPYGDGCINNGTLYASGSAMTTSSLCQYCYCIGGKQRCLKPRCLLPLDGCTPKYSPLSCCPTQYNCTKAITTTTTTIAPSPFNGCEIDGLIYPEGEKILSVTRSPCDNCYCMRGIVRCVPLTCAPPLHGCKPIIQEGKCCASSYDCTQQFVANSSPNEVTTPESSGTLKEFIINERSFPDNTPLTPSEIADLLRNTAGRFIRRIENKTASSNETESNENTTQSEQIKFNTTEVSTETPVLNSTTPGSVNIKITPTTSAEEIITLKEEQNGSTTAAYIERSEIMKKILNDTVNCTTEISQINSTESNSVDTVNPYNDTESRIINFSSKNILSEVSDDELLPVTQSPNELTEIGSQFPSTSFIIPKDNDIFMVNVSTHVRTNISNEVTLKPVARIPPEIEALLNMSLKKNNNKDDYMDYDYKSSLPPSLPNLEIIPFLAVDAVLKRDETQPETDEANTAYPPPYPILNEEDKYLDQFATGSQNSYNSSPYSYDNVGDHFVHTTHPVPYEEEKYPVPSLNTYHRPSVYKQHIGDKFKASTYKPVFDEPDKSVYAQEKIDEAVDDEDQTDNFDFLETMKNLFSPPAKTEGGFLPRDPPMINSYYETSYPTEGGSPPPNDVGSIKKDDKSPEICFSDGKQYKNGELITENDSCMACFCCYGDIRCHVVECSSAESGFKTILDKNLDPCSIKHVPTSTSSTTISTPIISTFVVPSKVIKMSTTLPTTTSTTERVSSTISSSSLIQNLLYQPSTTRKPTTEEPEYFKDDEEEEFSLESVLKLFLGDDADTTTAKATRRYPTPVPITMSSITTTTEPPTTTTTSTTTSTTPTPTTTVSVIVPKVTAPIPSTTILPNLLKSNNYKYSFSKPNRTLNSVTPPQKNFTKPAKPTPRPSPTYYSVTRLNKYKLSSTPAPLPLVTQGTKITYPTIAPRDHIKTQYTKRPPYIPTESPIPFGAGLLKLAGCNIYGRMYRVGKIISELSGPCIECMCTDFGVQCKPLAC